MLKDFVPAADEVHRLFHGQGPECDLFRAIAKDGHYGAHATSRTRQGTYVATPNGVLLDLLNVLGSWGPC